MKMKVNNETIWTITTNMPGEAFVVRETESNPHADPRYANNGGGYHQPQFVLTADKLPNWELTLLDTSCGDFGTRYSAELTLHGEVVASAYWGSMYDEISTEFTARWDSWCRAAKLLGFDIPTTWSREYIRQEYNAYFPKDQ
jgi:hypothetical protein